MSSSSSSNDGGGCCSLILIIIVIWLIFYATSADVREWTNRLIQDEEAAEDAGDVWAENYPWPHSEVDAIQKCIFAIQSRNWQNYQGCFEPSTMFTQEEPGLPGTFDIDSITLMTSDGKVGIVYVSGWWTPSSLTGVSDILYFSEEVTVVKARKGFFKDVEVNVDFAMEGWFVAYTELEKLPFNFSSKMPSLQPTSTSTPTPTRTATSTPILTPDVTVTP